MQNTVPITFRHTLSNGAEVEINARVDTRTEQEVYDAILPLVRGNMAIVSKSFSSKKTIDIHWHVASILKKEAIEQTKEMLALYPIIVCYLSQLEMIYVEYDNQKAVEIQTIFYADNNIKHVLLNFPQFVREITTQAIIEANKPTTICSQ